MTVTTTANKVSYAGNGVTTSFSFSFACQATGDIQVFVTDSAGTVTQIAANLFTVTLNAAISPNPTPIGGTVTYPLTGSPLATGNTITILRTETLDQATSLSNQGTVYQTTIEATLDNLAMQIQQLNELLGRQITVAVSDPNPAALPAVATRASLPAIFDSSGNLTAGAAAATGLISAAMQPVVDAATLALGRTAFGLGAMAVEGIGSALEDDGAGNARVFFNIVADSISQSVTSSFQLNERIATGALTYTNPKASTLFKGFGYWVYATDSYVTLAIDAADSFSGMGTGTSYIIPPGTRAFVSTDGTATWFVGGVQALGLETPLNCRINASVGSNALTITLKDNNGNDPSKTSPVVIPFRDATATNGEAVLRAVTNALSIVIPNGASLGTANAVPFRVWVVAFDNAGSVVLGAIVCVVGGSSPTQIFPLVENQVQSATAISAGATSAATYYAASSITSKSFRVLGYIDFSSGQVTAGAWATSPDKIQLFGPGIRKPGDTIQVAQGTTSTTTASNGASNVQTALTVSITITSKISLVEVSAVGNYSGTPSNAASYKLQLSRGAGPTLIGNVSGFLGGGANTGGSLVNYVLDQPQVAAAQAYFVYWTAAGATGINYLNLGAGVITAKELMV